VRVPTVDNWTIHTGPIPRFSRARSNSARILCLVHATTSGLSSSWRLSCCCTALSVRLNVPLKQTRLSPQLSTYLEQHKQQQNHFTALYQRQPERASTRRNDRRHNNTQCHH